MKVKYKRSKLQKEGRWRLYVCIQGNSYVHREYWEELVKTGTLKPSYRKTDEWREYKP